jgi:phenylacetate-CoA ligase
MIRMTKVLKRTDPMLCVRGINVFPEKVEEVLTNFKGVGPGYALVPTGKRGMYDQLMVRVEASPEIMEASEDRRMLLKERVRLAFRRAVGLGVEVEFMKSGKS